MTRFGEDEEEEPRRRPRPTRAGAAVFLVAVVVLGIVMARAERGDDAAAPTPKPCPSGEGVCPDGKPGWTSGFTGCQPTEGDPGAVASVELVPGVTARLAVDDGAAGTELRVRVRVENTSASAVEVEVPVSPQPGLDGGAQRFGNPHAPVPVSVRPGTTYDAELTARTTRCGDTSSDPEPPLSAGDHVVYLATNIAVDGEQKPVSLKAPVVLS